MSIIYHQSSSEHEVVVNSCMYVMPDRQAGVVRGAMGGLVPASTAEDT